MLALSLKEAGYEVFVVNDGQSSIQIAKDQKPDLIILDIMMPDVGGTEVRAELIKDPVTKNIPIIFLTGLKAPAGKEGPRHSAVKKISKSADIKELLKAIRETLALPQ